MLGRTVRIIVLRMAGAPWLLLLLLTFHAAAPSLLQTCTSGDTRLGRLCLALLAEMADYDASLERQPQMKARQRQPPPPDINKRTIKAPSKNDDQ